MQKISQVLERKLADPEIPHWLKKYLEDGSVAFFIEDIKIAEILLDQVSQYQSRIQVFDPDIVTRYAIAIDNGAKFPPIVIAMNKKGKWEIVDGIHRTMGYRECGMEVVKAITLRGVSHDSRVSMAAECNATHGMPYTTMERVMHGIALVDNGFTQPRAAEMVGVTTSRISEAMILRDADNRARQTGVDLTKWVNVRPTARRTVQRIHDNRVFRAAAELSIVTSITTTDLNKMVQDIAKARDADAGLLIIEEYRQNIGIQAIVKTNDGIKTSPRTRFLGGIRIMERLIEKVDLAPEEVLRTRRVCQEVLARLERYHNQEDSV